jgi:drug/metabolite transporter (DMT)-like permease
MWFLYALLGAVGKSYSGFFRKKMAGNVSGAMYMWLSYAAIVVVLCPILFINSAEVISMLQQSWLIVLIVSVSSISATILNIEALKREELSYTAPLNAFVPVFTLIIAGLFLGESLHALGVVGIFIIVIGAYVININPGKIARWYTPLVSLFKNTGARITLAVTFSFAINSVFIKVLTNQSYDPFTILYVTTAITWLLLAYVPIVKRSEFRLVAKSNKLIVLGGTVSSFAGTFFHILAVAGTYASYAVAVRRLEAPISVILGWRHLKETNIRNKLIGSLFMVGGAVIIAIF